MNENIYLKNISGDKFTNDPDDSMKAREHYLKYWGDHWKEKECDNMLFRGDTIISFNTVAGCMIRLLPIYEEKDFSMPSGSKERLDIIMDSKEVEDDLKSNFQTFHQYYHTLANFMPLVKLKTYVARKESPYLQFVKSDDYHDFPDLFFIAIKKYYTGERDNTKFNHQDNKDFFDSFGKDKDGWKAFVEKNYLQDFFEDKQYNKVVELSPNNIKMPYQKLGKMNDVDKKNCIEAIGKFLIKAIKIIENRARRFEKIEKEHYGKNQNVEEG